MALEVLKYSAKVIWTTFMAFLCGDLHTVCGRYECCCIIQKLKNTPFAFCHRKTVWHNMRVSQIMFILWVNYSLNYALEMV